MVDITLITSLYRGEAHLPLYGQRVREMRARLQSAGIALQILVVANDTTENERRWLADLPVRVIYTGRETLYASWNRGIAAAESDIFGFWHVDDDRAATALIEGYHRLQQGYTLVDTPMRIVQSARRFGLFAHQRTWIRPVPFDPVQFTRKNGISPFALIRRELYEQTGGFDEHFRIAGDLEWGGRAMPYAKFAPLTMPGGTFFLHGGNLSSTGNPLQRVEENIVFLRRQQWTELRPADPVLMRQTWEAWGSQGLPLPDAIQEWLWGDESARRYRHYLREKEQPAWMQRLRLALVKRGLVSSVEWEIRKE